MSVMEISGGFKRPPSICDMEHILEYRSQARQDTAGCLSRDRKGSESYGWSEGIRGTEVSELGLVFGHSKLATADTQTERLTGR